MFSLIITIISIALVAALALATIYYGGSAFTKGGDAAKASQLINEGQQLQGARTLAVADAVALSTLSALSPTYLSQVPGSWTTNATTAGDFAGATAFVTTSTISDAVCEEVNAKAQGRAAVSPAPVPPASVPATQVYGCAGTGAGLGVVSYKF